MVVSLKTGDEIFVVFKSRLPEPTRATIIAITDTIGKIIGVQFSKPLGLHSCDGLGKDGHCLWLHPNHVLTIERGEMLLKQIEASKSEFMLEINDKNEKRIVKLG